MPFHLTEPHPSVPRSSYLHSGRGGAGNYKYIDASTITSPSSATGPASATRLPASDARAFTSGRGGAGNVHRGAERAIFSFDEELDRQRVVEAKVAPVYHIGRGGAGNLIDDRRPSLESERHGSASSIMSNHSDASDHKARTSVEAAL
ncbi:hypothetical protein MMC16_004689 [Acarospora aff. strigata]|nr:hypothetical protein [Acarospora aff. strigata]